MTNITVICSFEIYTKLLFKLGLHGVQIDSKLCLNVYALCGDRYGHLNGKNVSALKDTKGEAKGEYDLPKK